MSKHTRSWSRQRRRAIRLRTEFGAFIKSAQGKLFAMIYNASAEPRF